MIITLPQANIEYPEKTADSELLLIGGGLAHRETEMADQGDGSGGGVESSDLCARDVAPGTVC